MNMNHIFFLFFSFLCLHFGLKAQVVEGNPYTKFVAFKSENKWGFKVESQTVIPSKFEYVTHFSENFSLVKENGMWGYIDTLGNWFIEPKFEKGQPFQDGRAFIKKDGKTGLVIFNGNEVFTNFLDENGNPKEEGFYRVEYSWKYHLEPIYDNIKEDYSSYYLYQNGKIGFKSKDNESLPAIPCLYDSLYPLYSNLVSGKKVNNKWDVYENGILILEDIDHAIKYANYDYSSSNYIVSKDEMFGVYSLSDKWIVKPSFASIDKLNFPAYTTNFKTYEMIYALHEKSQNEIDPDYYNNVSSTDEITLVKANGEVISTIKFNAIKTYYDNYDELPKPFVLELFSNKKLIHLTKDFRIKTFDFTSVTPHNYNNFYFSSGGNKQYILDKSLNILDSFAQIYKYQELGASTELYDEYGNPIVTYDPETGEELFNYDQIMNDVEEPFLIVYREKNSILEKAVYDLIYGKIASSWFPEKSNLTVVRNYSPDDQEINGAQGKVIYTYFSEGDNRSKMGFYLQNVNEPSALIYEAQNNILVSKYNFVLNKFQGDKLIQELFSIKNNKLELISNQYEVISSSEIYVPESHVEDDYNYEYDPIVKKGYFTDFLILKQNTKFGLISGKGTVFAPQFDTLSQNTGSEAIINVTLNGKYGIVDLMTDKYISPIMDEENYFNQFFYTLNRTNYFATIYNDNSYYFLSTNGKKFYSFDGLIFPRKVKRNYGLFVYNKEIDSKNALVQVPAQFKFLEQSIFPDLFNAQGRNKKWGMINRIGDTLIPLKYSKVESLKANGDSFFTFKVFNKNKVGVFDFDKGEVIPPIYDKIEAFGEFEAYFEYLKIVLDGKSGVIDLKGKSILNPIYDSIILEFTYDEEMFLIGIKGKKRVGIPLNAQINDENLKEYDLTHNGEGYIRTNAGYEVYNLNTGMKERNLISEKIVALGYLYNIIEKNGKFGVCTSSGFETVPCEYDELSYNGGPGSDVLIGIQNGVKYYIYAETNQRYTEDQW